MLPSILYFRYYIIVTNVKTILFYSKKYHFLYEKIYNFHHFYKYENNIDNYIFICLFDKI